MNELKWVYRNSLLYPRFFCSVCGEEIMEAGQGGVDFTMPLDHDWQEGEPIGELIRVFHKGKCSRRMEIEQGWEELEAVIKQLCNNYGLVKRLLK